MKETIKGIDYYLGLPYTVEITRYKEGGYFVKVKELEGCMTEADTVEEAYAMIIDAMKSWFEIALGDGVKIPLPESEGKYSGKFIIRAPKSLHKKLAENARREGVSLNSYLIGLLSASTAENKRS